MQTFLWPAVKLPLNNKKNIYKFLPIITLVLVLVLLYLSYYISLFLHKKNSYTFYLPRWFPWQTSFNLSSFQADTIVRETIKNKSRRCKLEILVLFATSSELSIISPIFLNRETSSKHKIPLIRKKRPPLSTDFNWKCSQSCTQEYTTEDRL